MADFDIDAYLGKETKKRGFDIDSYLAQPATTARKEQGKALVSLADTALNTITGGFDELAYPLANYYYGTAGKMSPADAAAKARAETTSPKDVFGRAFGYKDQTSYESNPFRQAGTYIGQELGENVITPVAQVTGIPEQSVANMIGSATLGLAPAVPKVVAPVKAVARNVADVSTGLGSLAMSPVQTMKGVVGGFTNDVRPPSTTIGKPYETTSARMPIGDTYIPASVLEQYRAGQITADQATALSRPTTELPLGALQRTQGLVPFKGQEARAAGEQFGSGYRDPYKAAAEIGLDVLTAGGIPTTARLLTKGYDLGKTAQAYRQLGQSGFSPLTPAEAAALRSQPPKAGPVVPTAPPPPPPPPATLQSLRQPPAMPPAVTPAATAQAAAAAQVAPPATPIQAAAQQTVAQRAQQVMGDKYRAPVTETPAPIAGPAVPAGPIVETTPRKLTLDEIMAQINKKKEGVFETAGEKPAAPLDIETVRTNFANQIEQQRKNMMETREQNKETYAETGTALSKEPVAKRPGERPSFTPPSSEIITPDAALKAMIKTSGDVKSYKNTIIVNRNAYNDFATDAGVALDWTTAPDVSKMGVADARRATNKWVYESIKRDAPDLGLGQRSPSQKAQEKEYHAQLDKERAERAFEDLSNTPEQSAQEAANIKASIMERSKRLRRPDNLEMMTDESKQPTATSKQVLKDKNLAIDEALANKLSKNTHDISYRMPGGLTVRDIKSKGRSEIVQSDKNGLEVSYITEGTGAAKQYIRRTIDRDGAVLKSETFTEKPTDWIRGLLEPLPEPTTTKADFLQDKMLADLSGEILPAKVYKDGDITVIAKPLQMFNKLEPAQKKQYLANGGLTHVSQRLDPTGKIDYKNMDKQLKQIQAAINKLD